MARREVADMDTLVDLIMESLHKALGCVMMLLTIVIALQMDQINHSILLPDAAEQIWKRTRVLVVITSILFIFAVVEAFLTRQRRRRLTLRMEQAAVAAGKKVH